ncbi:UNVERIFIED_CONTAM: Zinc finger protein ZAT6 [Sesamum latifolium]|uniref:Zinc finger protein ZAT6 n=1 Tax=Sesamum latifolium TaxID=2727402 RepID=A0AAW2XZ73_9LAMI
MERLIIKIKIPRADELQFACPVCSRSFASGKALGGHKRVHMQKGKKSSHQRRELQIADGREAGNVVKSFNCPVCPQSFVSDKSLHGHMRAHPERNWRGMKPPTPELENGGNSSLVPVSGSAVALLGDGSEGDNELGSDVPLLEWPRLARRSRHGKAPMDVPADPDYQEELSVCGAYDLMALANGEPAGREDLAPKKKRLELAVSTGAGSSGNSSRNKKAIVLGGDKITNPGLESSVRRKAIVLGGGLSVANRDKIPNPGPESSTRREGSLSVNSNVNVRNKVPVKAPKQYICSICDRSFRSYHALGGHKAHHIVKDARVRYSVGIDNESTTAGPLVPYVGQPHGCSRDVVHRCPFCDNIFSTSRDLIDHRRQCSGPAEPVNEVLHPGGEETRNQSIVVHKFDLNELPPEWTDEDC